jgi:hypothetical protein
MRKEGMLFTDYYAEASLLIAEGSRMQAMSTAYG